MEECLEINYVDSDITDFSTESHSVKKQKIDKRVTDANMTSFEYSRALSFRANQLAMGHKPQVEWDGPYDPIAIAKLEIEQRVAPLIIERKIPDAKLGYRTEEWSLKEMNIRDW